ncbi:hypothetical protein GC194_00120 [bacterium]|nr:hypothetical protein [bacterium]
MNEIDQTIKLPELKLLNHYEFASVYVADDVCLVKATSTYIPTASFRQLFETVGEIVKKSRIKKFIFDKSNLMVFDQASMAWYFTQWKDEMYQYGLSVHRKILPADKVFKECVLLGREQINIKYPDAKFHKMDIRYSRDLKDALEN